MARLRPANQQSIARLWPANHLSRGFDPRTIDREAAARTRLLALAEGTRAPRKEMKRDYDDDDDDDADDDDGAGDARVGASPLLLYCLLYTSPSPRDRQKSRMPSSA